MPTTDLKRLREEDPSAFSATAVLRGPNAIIVVNDAHTSERQANSVAHELAHLLLDHPPGPMIDDYGARTLTKDHEDEANWLAGCLLVPGSGISQTMSECGGTLEVAAAHYGVSVELMRWRQNMTQRRPKRSASAEQ